MTVYVVAWERSDGNYDFNWYKEKPEAQAAFRMECDLPRPCGYFEHHSKHAGPTIITEEIDNLLWHNGLEAIAVEFNGVPQKRATA